MRIQVRLDGSWDGFRQTARGLLAHRVPSDRVDFITENDRSPGLFGGAAPPVGGTPPALPRAFFAQAERAAAFDAPDRWSLVYRVALRLASDRGLLSDIADPDVLAFTRRAKHVARDVHKMHAFVRFRALQDGSWAAFHRPDHWIVPLAVPHFANRFGDSRFVIATPKGTALHVPGEAVRFGPAASDPGRELGEFEELWNTYYANIYNPSRTMVDAMLAEMPRKHWATMPETAQIPKLLRERAGRLVAGRSGVTLPDDRSLASLASAVRACQACPLGDHGLRGVAGHGPDDAQLAIVGEQPGDVEDQRGRPFVGPAGRVLDQALDAVGLQRDAVYLTNAVKHFRHHWDGPRRIHDAPERYHVEVCRTFVFGELDTLKPRVTVALGATAARSLLGKVVPVQAAAVHRSRFGPLVVGPHPAAILRRPDLGLQPLIDTLAAARDLLP